MKKHKTHRNSNQDKLSAYGVTLAVFSQSPLNSSKIEIPLECYFQMLLGMATDQPRVTDFAKLCIGLLCVLLSQAAAGRL